jgi:hypothetical protein
MAWSFFLGAGPSLVFPALDVPGMVNGLQGSEDFYSFLMCLTIRHKNECFIVKLWKCIVQAPFSRVGSAMAWMQSRAEIVSGSGKMTTNRTEDSERGIAQVSRRGRKKNSALPHLASTQTSSTYVGHQ